LLAEFIDLNDALNRHNEYSDTRCFAPVQSILKDRAAVVILYSHSPSRKQAIKVLLVIIKDDLPIFHVSEISEIPGLLDKHLHEVCVLILDNWFHHEEMMTDLVPLIETYPSLRTLTLLEEDQQMHFFPPDDKNRVLVGNFDPNEFVQLVRHFLLEKSLP